MHTCEKLWYDASKSTTICNHSIGQTPQQTKFAAPVDNVDALCGKVSPKLCKGKWAQVCNLQLFANLDSYKLFTCCFFCINGVLSCRCTAVDCHGSQPFLFCHLSSLHLDVSSVFSEYPLCDIKAEEKIQEQQRKGQQKFHCLRHFCLGRDERFLCSRKMIGEL